MSTPSVSTWVTFSHFWLAYTDWWQLPIHTITSKQNPKNILRSLFETTNPQSSHPSQERLTDGRVIASVLILYQKGGIIFFAPQLQPSSPNITGTLRQVMWELSKRLAGSAESWPFFWTCSSSQHKRLLRRERKQQRGGVVSGNTGEMLREIWKCLFRE